MDAGAHGRAMEEAVDDVDLVLDRFQRLEGSAKLHVLARALRPPMMAVDAVAHKKHGEALRRRGAPKPRRRKGRERNGSAGRAEKRATGTMHIRPPSRRLRKPVRVRMPIRPKGVTGPFRGR